jgi:hypothetical protein
VVVFKYYYVYFLFYLIAVVLVLCQIRRDVDYLTPAEIPAFILGDGFVMV